MNSPDSEILEKTVVVTNVQGLHSRPALAISQAAKRQKVTGIVIMNGQTATITSILELLCLAASEGTELTIRIRGETAAAVQSVFDVFVTEISHQPATEDSLATAS